MKRLLEMYADGSFHRCRLHRTGPMYCLTPRVGLLWNWRAAWIGFHHSKLDKRLCVNVVPFLTIWYVRPGGKLP